MQDGSNVTVAYCLWSISVLGTSLPPIKPLSDSCSLDPLGKATHEQKDKPQNSVCFVQDQASAWAKLIGL